MFRIFVFFWGGRHLFVLLWEFSGNRHGQLFWRTIFRVLTFENTGVFFHESGKIEHEFVCKERVA